MKLCLYTKGSIAVSPAIRKGCLKSAKQKKTSNHCNLKKVNMLKHSLRSSLILL